MKMVVSEDLKIRLERLEQVIDIQARVFDFTWKHISEIQNQMKNMQDIMDDIIKQLIKEKME